jgi:hypothetical protein
MEFEWILGLPNSMEVSTILIDVFGNEPSCGFFEFFVDDFVEAERN